MTPRQRRPREQSTVDWYAVEAGGIVPALDAGGRPGADVVTARSYGHPVLAGRTVVRLVPSALGEAEDLALEFLGFTTDGEPRPVGTGARRAVGFPAWAVVHDPANGRHALAMVKELERLARLATGRPGAAMEGYEALADRLQRAVPHFLPTFWEQAARSFVEAGSPKQAAVCFTRARDAERVHGLAIDEGRVADVHLEFALAGALPVKALTRYAQDLAGRLPADEAYRRYREVAVQRVAGGLAPPAGLLTELGRLARAAKLRVDDELPAVVAELVARPAVATAAGSFWDSARPHLVAVCRQDPTVRARLLEIQPDPPGWRTDITEQWVGLLDATGASDLLTGPASTAESVGAGAWLERFLAHRARKYSGSRSPALLALVQRMIPRLLAQDREVRAIGDAWWADIDVLDVLLAGGVAVKPPDEPAVTRGNVSQLNVVSWVEDPTPGQRDLLALTGDPALSRLWRRGVVGALRRGEGGRAREPWVARLAAVPAIRTAIAQWVAEMAERAGDLPLAALLDLIDELRPLRNRAGAGVNPAASRRLAAAPVATALARTLRTGLAGELRWPAHEEAVGRLGAQATVSHAATWPYLIVHDEHRAVVLGEDRVLLEHAMRLPTRGHHDRALYLRYVDGRLLVMWHGYPDRAGYWSDRPGDVFDRPETEWPHSSAESTWALTLPDGGVTTGGAPLRAGDRVHPPTSRVISDGSAYWRQEIDGAGHDRQFRWREYDPATGAAGRFSQPRFFDDAPGPLRPHDSVLLPPPTPGASAVGMRVWTGPDGSVMGSDVDGRIVTAGPDRGQSLRLAVVLPGAHEPCAVSSTERYGHADVYTICEAGTGLPASRSEPGREVPPVLWWRLATPRDPAGSAALRSVTDEQAERLVAGVGGTTAPERTARADELVRAVLPEITDDRLVADVRREVIRTWDAARRLAEWGAHAGSDAADDGGAVRELVAQYTVPQAIDGFNQIAVSGGYWSAERIDLGGEIDKVGQLLTGAAADLTLPERDWVPWPSVLGAEAALALRMLGPGVVADHRTTLRTLLDAFAHSPLVGTGGRIRVLNLATPAVPAPPRGTVLRYGDRTAVVLARWGESDRKGSVVQVVELGSKPGSARPDGMTIENEHRPTGWADRGRLGELVRQFDSAGPPPWRPEAVTRLVELTGLSRGSAALLLAGVPGLRSHAVNFLPRGARQTMGLSVAEARTGRDALAALPPRTIVTVLDAAMPADPADLWRTGPDVDALAAAWIHHCGRKVAVDPELLAEAARVLGGRSSGWSNRRDAVPVVESVLGTGGVDLLAPGALRPYLLAPSAASVAWLAYRLAADDPARSALPQAVARLRARLREPSFVVPLEYAPPGLVGSPALTGSALPNWPQVWNYELTPARLTGPDDLSLQLFPGVATVRAIAWLLSDGCTRLVGWTPPEGTPPGSVPHDPRVTAPSTVESVATALKLDGDAAVYYLQLLALPDPSDKNVARWTGWSARRVKALAETLTTAGLVVAAKRERAGRAVFLPGAWLALKAPDPPIEGWKTRLYGLAADGTGPLPALVPTTPVADLFADAWRQVQAGDGPRFESL